MRHVDRIDFDFVIKSTAQDQRCVFSPTGKLSVDELSLQTVAAQLLFAEHAVFDPELPHPEYFIEVREQMMLTAFVSAVRNPPLGRSNASLFAEKLVGQVAAVFGLILPPCNGREWQLMADIIHDGEPTEAELQFMRGWLRSLSSSEQSFVQPPQPPESPQGTGFVACPMTGVPDIRLHKLESLSRDITVLLRDWGIVAYQPIVETHPIRNAESAHDPVFIHATDGDKVAKSDIVIAIVDGPSSGLGVIAAYAERHQAIVVALVSDPSAGRSPLLLGISTLRRIIPVDSLTLEHVGPALARYFADGGYDEVLAHRRLREGRGRVFGGPRRHYRRALDTQGRAVVSRRLPAFFPIERLDEILSSDDHFAARTCEEDWLLRRVLRLNPQRERRAVEHGEVVGLTVRQLRAWADFVRLQRLGIDDAIELQERAIKSLADAVPAQRELKLQTHRHWADLYHTMRNDPDA